MNFEAGYIYHIYNQGNNHRNIFYKPENYQFFLRKVETYVKPYADILAYCLMPNHFHLMVLVNKLVIDSQGFTQSETLTSKLRQKSVGFTQSETLTGAELKKRTLNDSIGILLRSYTRAINKQENFSGALFRKETKAECVNCSKGLSPSFIVNQGISQIKDSNPKNQYPQICFDYIHQNPVKAGMVKLETDWEYSSARAYVKQVSGGLMSKNIAKEYGLVYSL